MDRRSPPIRILLVEDDDAYAGLIEAELRAAKLAPVVERRRTLQEGISLLANGHSGFDVVLLDLNLPDSAGLDTLARIREAAEDVPVVVLTAEADDALAIAALQKGAEDYLFKSATDVPLISRALRYAIERAGFRAALRSTEERLRQAQKMEAVGRLAGGVAHDFNNVLTAIFGYIDLLLEQVDEHDARRADLLEIRRSAERAASLTRQLLAFSRKQILQPRRIDLNEIVSGLEPMLTRLLMSDIELVLSLPPGLWPVTADPGQIEQVVLNLCANARDAMPDGGRLEIATFNQVVAASGPAARRGVEPGEYVALRVTDAGCGIPSAIREHIFDPFFTTKRSGQGTGLGLSTVYGIVQQSGGAITVESHEGRGSTFTVYLPRPRSAPTSSP